MISRAWLGYKSLGMMTLLTTTEYKAPESIEDVQNLLRDQVYISDRALAVPIFLAMKLQRPLFLEGEAGVGKTEIARALAAGLGTKLIRLQCYEGLDVNQAVYEWNHTRQLLEIRLMEAAGDVDRDADEKSKEGRNVVYWSLIADRGQQQADEQSEQG